jgi:transcriptional regulator with XRE-family HTH domain
MPSGRHLLNAWRKRAKLNQTQLAKALMVSSGYMSQVLTGKRTPTNLPFLTRIEALTGVPISSWWDKPSGKSGNARKHSADSAHVSR